MAKEIIIQPGMPKTGTTTLQNRLFQNHREYLYLGKHNNGSFYTYGEDVQDKWLLSLKRDLISKDLSFFENFDVEQMLLEEFGEAYRKHDKLFLSEEDILARCITPGQYGDTIRVGSAYEIFEKLKVLFDRSSFTSVKIVLVLRRQDDLIESFFAEEYQNFRSFLGLRTPEDFVSHLFENEKLENTDALFRYDELVGHLDLLFGKENVLVLPYEQLKMNPDGFLGDLSTFMGIENWANTHLLRKVKENSRDTSSGNGKVAKVRPLRENLAQLKRKILGDIPTGLGRHLKFIDRFQRDTVIKLDRLSRDKVLRNYAKENKQLKGRVKHISECSYF